jgi:hypothetical protein
MRHPSRDEIALLVRAILEDMCFEDPDDADDLSALGFDSLDAVEFSMQLVERLTAEPFSMVLSAKQEEVLYSRVTDAEPLGLLTDRLANFLAEGL